MTMAEEPELEEYEEIEDEQPIVEAQAGAKQGYVQAVSFDDMQLKRELLRAVQDAGFEHPSESTLGQTIYWSFPRDACFVNPALTCGSASNFPTLRLGPHSV